MLRNVCFQQATKIIQHKTHHEASIVNEPRTSRCSAGLRKARGTRLQIASIRGIIKKARKFKKNINFCFIDYAKAFDYVDHNILWEILEEMGIPDHLT